MPSTFKKQVVRCSVSKVDTISVSVTALGRYATVEVRDYLEENATSLYLDARELDDLISALQQARKVLDRER